MFSAFFDESGTDRTKDKAFIMGGFLGRVEEWLEASDAWDLCLHEHPKIEYFKHSEYQSLSGEFGRFNRQQADGKILSLANTIARFKLHGFCSIAPHGLIESKPANRGLLASRIYDWGFSGAIKLVLQHMHGEPVHEKVDFIFDRRTELRPNIENYYAMKENLVFEEFMSHAGACEPGDDRELVALQMADLLAAEFLIAGETQIQSPAFQVIRDNNKIGYLRVDPPAQHTSTLDLLNFGTQLQYEAGEFLKLDRQKLLTPQERLDRILDLMTKQAFFNVQHARLVAFLENNPEYQEFRRKYIAATGIDPMNPSEDS